ncbi:uncharacterized protein [Spinacia oleracea]|uniref:EF-hand domain-containing protein n=1 Tax=Spinacia oleracea TaxID=3562 RepID=A0A9R0JQ65_SPIOL|nr:uncharacterized protein LOC110783067 [Spinacia oleracea]
MAKGAVIYTLLTTAFVILILLPPSSRSHNGTSRHVRLFEGTYFDPLVTKIEHKVEEKGLNDHLSRDYVHEVVEVDVEVEEADKVYFGKDGKMNLTLRLTTLFPMIDNSPKDGYVEFRELGVWNIMQAKEGLDYSTRKELELNDKNKDGFISFNELFPQFSEEEIRINKTGHGETGWWMEQFRNADANQDGKLSLEELKDFLHPEESVNEKVEDWIMREKIRRMDWDKDGKLNFQEFRDNAYDIFKSYYHFSFDNDYVPSPELQFSNLDLNKDRFLTIQELKPIKQLLFPGVLDHASYYATYLMNEVDDNHDHKLTLGEILKHEDKFYKSVYVGDEEDDHDEL